MKARNQKTPADPLNLVVIGPGVAGLKTFIARGWDLTETIHGAAIWRTIQSSLFGRLYRNSPVSPLYYTGDPYWTDGLRAIIEVSKEPVFPSQVHYLDWVEPKAVQLEQNEVTASP